MDARPGLATKDQPRKEAGCIQHKMSVSLDIQWHDFVPNSEVRERPKPPPVSSIICKLRLSWLGQVIRLPGSRSARLGQVVRLQTHPAWSGRQAPDPPGLVRSSGSRPTRLGQVIRLPGSRPARLGQVVRLQTHPDWSGCQTT